MSTRLLPDWLESYLLFVKRSEPPVLYHKWTALSTIAACLRRKCKLEWGTIDVYPNLYVVLVGPPGKCRKGTAMKVGERFLRDMGIKLSSNTITREALIHQLKTSSDTHIDPNGKMYLHSSLTVFSKELTVFLGYNNLQLISDLTDWFDCDEQWEYRTKNMGVDDITGVWVNLIGATTPDLLNTTLPRDAIGGGLTSRMIFVYENNKDHTELSPFLTKEEIDLRVALSHDLERISMLQGHFRASPEYIEKWTSWYAMSDSGPPPFEDHRFAGYFERRPTHLWKMSMICNASRTDSMILDGEDFERALSILTHTERLMPFTFSGMGKNTNADILNRAMVLLGRKREMQLEELQRLRYMDADARTLDGLVKTMELMGYVNISHRGSEIWLVYKNKDEALCLNFEQR